MSSWNYRVVKRKSPNDIITFAIHEVFYDDNDIPASITDTPSWPLGDTLEELKKDLEHYQKALFKPVLKYEDFESE